MPAQHSVHRPARYSLLSAALLLFALCSVVCWGRPAQPKFKVVALAEGGGLHQPFVDAARIWLAREEQEGGFTVDYIEDTKSIDDAFLAQYRLFIELNYPPHTWTPAAAAGGSVFITQPCSAGLTAMRCGPGSLRSWTAFVS